MNRDEVFGDVWYVKNITKCKIFGSGSINRTMTNVFNAQTCSVAHLDVVVAVVEFAEGEAVEVARDVVGGSSVRIPVRIHLVPSLVPTSVGAGDVGRRLLLLAMEGTVKALVALHHNMTDLATKLADRALPAVGASAAVAVAATIAATIAATLIATASLVATAPSTAVAATLAALIASALIATTLLTTRTSEVS
jgi:hypothetical protein